jgi:hypothetical protein
MSCPADATNNGGYCEKPGVSWVKPWPSWWYNGFQCPQRCSGGETTWDFVSTNCRFQHSCQEEYEWQYNWDTGDYEYVPAYVCGQYEYCDTKVVYYQTPMYCEAVRNTDDPRNYNTSGEYCASAQTEFEILYA